MIKQIHLDQCHSTQDVLKEQLINSGSRDSILISCDHQISGRGRGANSWISMPGSVCFSLNIVPHQILSFTAIEIAVILTDFFESRDLSLKLKWPNDLWNQKLEKCGGILVQGSQGKLMAGIGLNLFSNHQEFGGVFSSEFSVDKKIWASDMGSFILKNRITNIKTLKEKWQNRCGHLDKIVTITEGTQITEGIFQGLGDFGEALILFDGKIQRIYNGGLRISQA